MIDQTKDTQQLLEEIASTLGTTVEVLLENGKTPEQVVEEFRAGKLRILND